VRRRLCERTASGQCVLIGRTEGASLPELSQEDAVRRALGDLGVPVILDVDTGHQPPQMPLVDGALAEIALSGRTASITQRLVPRRCARRDPVEQGRGLAARPLPPPPSSARRAQGRAAGRRRVVDLGA
jgi:hypothetical protein